MDMFRWADFPSHASVPKGRKVEHLEKKTGNLFESLSGRNHRLHREDLPGDSQRILDHFGCEAQDMICALIFWPASGDVMNFSGFVSHIEKMQ